MGPEWRRVCFGWEVGPPQGLWTHCGVAEFIISVQGLKLEVTQIIGPVVDVQLKSSVPAWRIPTPVRVAQSIRAGHVTVEVQHPTLEP